MNQSNSNDKESVFLYFFLFNFLLYLIFLA